MAQLCTPIAIGVFSALGGAGCFLFHEGDAPAAPAPGPTPRDAAPAAFDGGGAPPERADAAAAASCEPMRARRAVCGPVCDDAGPFVWDGDRCMDLSCSCAGEDCPAAYASLAECERAHAACPAILCASTGGAWRRSHEYCAPFRCGHADETITCRAGAPACDCGLGRSFDPVSGCSFDPTCTPLDHCLATGGRLPECSPGEACSGDVECDCGPGRVLDATRGCVRDPSAPPPPPDVLCTWSGGTWGGASCCPTECGRACPDTCVSPDCACGPLEIFDPLRGCTRDDACLDRLLGERCGDHIGVVCASPTVCCAAGGVTDLSVCTAPCCGDPGCDAETGCRPDVP